MSLSTDYSRSLNQPDLTQLELPHLDPEARAVLEFWFDEDSKPYWFVADDEFDRKIFDHFHEMWQATRQGTCASWRRNEGSVDIDNAITNLAGRLAEIIVLDQFSRNLCRGQSVAFAQDNMALVLAQEAIQQPHFDNLPMQWRRFIIMPFMHSESLVIHEKYLSLFKQLSDENTLNFAHHHRDIIERFGRYPHRNDVLNRKTTAEEKVFLQQPNSSF